ncbi:MAG: ATP-binding protein [Sciscionella sp.]
MGDTKPGKAPDDSDQVPRPVVHNVMSGNADTVLQVGTVHGTVNVLGSGRRQLPPRQLPAVIAAFTDRTEQIAELDTLLAGATESGSAAVVIATLSGTAGVGKTALAVQWARSVDHHFPEGQLYVDMQGYGPQEPVSAADILDRFLRALGTRGEEIPADLAERTARFRTLLDRLRVLIVLDNVAGVDQVRPLLPGSPSCFVIVTSRDTLSGLVVRDGAARIGLQPLPAAEAVDLLRTIVGERITREPDTASTLVKFCGRLPLALRIAAELVVSRPDTSIAELARELGDERRRLDLLDAGDDPQTAVRAVFSWSYHHLPDAATTVFRFIGLHPGQDITTEAVAALTDTAVPVVQRQIDMLIRGNMLERHGSGRHRMHDLLRVYAAELCTEYDQPSDRDEAVTRLFHHYLGKLDNDQSGWLDVERANIIALIVKHGSERSDHVLRLSSAIGPFLHKNAYYADAVTLHTHGAAAARSLDLPEDEARELDHLGVVHRRLGRFDQAAQAHQRALDLARAADDLALQGVVLDHLGLVHTRLGDYTAAITHHEQALALHRRLGQRAAQGRTLNNLGIAHRRRGEYREAIDHHRQALTIAQEVGIALDEANASTSMGIASRRAGRFEDALEFHRRALTLHRSIANRMGEASALTRIAMVYERLHRPEDALENFTQAVAVYRQAGNRAGEGKALTNLGVAWRKIGRHAESLDELERGLATLRLAGDRGEQAHAHNAMGVLHRETGRFADALECFDAAITLHEAVGNQVDTGHVLINVAATRQLLDQPEAALDSGRRALEIAERTGNAELYQETRHQLSELAMANGDPDAALEHREQALTQALTSGNAVSEAEAHDRMATVLAECSRLDEARGHWRRAAAIYAELNLVETDAVRARARAAGVADVE